MRCPRCDHSLAIDENPCPGCRAYVAREQIGACSECGTAADLRFGRCFEHLRRQDFAAIDRAIGAASVVIVFDAVPIVGLGADELRTLRAIADGSWKLPHVYRETGFLERFRRLQAEGFATGSATRTRPRGSQDISDYLTLALTDRGRAALAAKGGA